jgi:hypothetical protein
MAGYWWECEACGKETDFLTTGAAASLASFVWDRLIPSDWDQSLLTAPCSAGCAGPQRITYHFPRDDRMTLRVIHIVGLKSDDYVPMMWETYSTESPSERMFDFKYQRGRNPWGLNKAAVFSRSDLHQIFALYRDKPKALEFP